MSSMRRWLRDPISVFFLLGVLLFVAYGIVNDDDAAQPVMLSAAVEALIVAEFESLTGRPVTVEDRERLVEEHYRREVLFREGLAGELPQSDPELRETVIERMQQRVSGELPEPDARDLVNFYADHIERYYSEDTISFEQRFFGDQPLDGAAVLELLRRGELPDGDAAWQGKFFPRYGHSMIRGLFGQSLLDTLQALPPDVWMGPFESPDGWHFLRVLARSPAELLPFERVRDQVLADYQAAELERRVATFINARRDRYPLQRER